MNEVVNSKEDVAKDWAQHEFGSAYVDKKVAYCLPSQHQPNVNRSKASALMNRSWKKNRSLFPSQWVLAEREQRSASPTSQHEVDLLQKATAS